MQAQQLEVCNRTSVQHLFLGLVAFLSEQTIILAFWHQLFLHYFFLFDIFVASGYVPPPKPTTPATFVRHYYTYLLKRAFFPHIAT